MTSFVLSERMLVMLVLGWRGLPRQRRKRRSKWFKSFNCAPICFEWKFKFASVRRVEIWYLFPWLICSNLFNFEMIRDFFYDAYERTLADFTGVIRYLDSYLRLILSVPTIFVGSYIFKGITHCFMTSLSLHWGTDKVPKREPMKLSRGHLFTLQSSLWLKRAFHHFN